MLRSEFQLDQLHQNDGEQDARRTRWTKNCGKVEADVKPGFEDWSKFFDCAESQCIQPSGDTQSTLSERFDSSREYGEARTERPHQNNAAWSSQVWQKDAERDESTTRLVAAGTNQDLLSFRESSESTRRLVALMAGNSESIDGDDILCPHNLHTSTANVSNLDKVFSNVRQKFGRKPGDKMEDLDVNTSIWENLWPPLFKPQFILETIIWRIHILPKTSLCEHWDRCSMWQESWSMITKKSKVYPWSTGSNKLGKGQLCLLIMQFSYQMQKLSILWLSAVYGKDQWKSRRSLGGEGRLVSEFTSIGEVDQIGGEPVEFSSEFKTWWLACSVSLGNSWGANHLRVKVKRPNMWRKRKQRIVSEWGFPRTRLAKRSSVRLWKGTFFLLSSFFFLLSSFFSLLLSSFFFLLLSLLSHPESFLKIMIFPGKSDVLGRLLRGRVTGPWREKWEKWTKIKMKKNEKKSENMKNGKNKTQKSEKMKKQKNLE